MIPATFPDRSSDISLNNCHDRGVDNMKWFLPERELVSAQCTPRSLSKCRQDPLLDNKISDQTFLYWHWWHWSKRYEARYPGEIEWVPKRGVGDSKLKVSSKWSERRWKSSGCLERNFAEKSKLGQKTCLRFLPTSASQNWWPIYMQEEDVKQNTTINRI